MGRLNARALDSAHSGATNDSVSDEDLVSLSIQELVSFLGSSCKKSDYDRVERILVSREAALRSENEEAGEELILKDVELLELGSKCESLERELNVLRSKCADLEDRERSSSLEIEKYKGICAGFEEQIAGMRDEYRMAHERTETEIRAGSSAVNEIEGWKRRLGELKSRVSDLVDDHSRLRGKEGEGDQKLEEAKGNDQLGEDSGKARKDDDRNIKVLPKQDVRVVEKPVFSGVIVISDGEDEMHFNSGGGKEDTDMEKISFQSERNSWRRIEAMHLAKDIVTAVKDFNSGGGKEDTDMEKINFQSERNSWRRIEAMHLAKDIVTAVKDDDDDDDDGKERFISTLTPKRKSCLRVITSDSENEDADDRIPIGKLKTRRVGEVVGEESNSLANCSSDDGDCTMDNVTASRRRLIRLGECKKKRFEVQDSPSASVILNTTPVNEDDMAPRRRARRRATVQRKLGFADDEEEELDAVGSESEGESLGGFIVDDAKGEESECGSDSPSSSSSEELSETDFHEALAKIHRQKDIKGWKYEADMLSAFSRDPELCMKAVCALYRQQTSEEQSFKESFLINNRGFNKLDAHRGCMIAEFLLDGAKYGPSKKSVDDLQKYDPWGPDYCLQLARKYSKQLFAIYENKEDPFFLPS